jgi:DNA-binding HxlR family transcriptional regulator
MEWIRVVGSTMLYAMSTYGQYCPLALAAEALCERWNLLIVSRVIDGCRRFNEIHRGVPKISATLLSRRLLDLEKAGIIVRTPLTDAPGHDYRLTDAGRALEPIVMELAVWGQHWARDMTREASAICAARLPTAPSASKVLRIWHAICPIGCC